MAEPVPAGSDVSAGTYRCADCGKELQIGSKQSMPPCPSCSGSTWHTVSGGGDSSEDPYPNQ